MSLYDVIREQEERKRAVWKKGHIILGYDQNVWRRDDYGYAMCYTQYGNRDSEYGWEIDHIVPVSKGGSDHLFNLRPLNWQANAQRGGLLRGRRA